MNHRDEFWLYLIGPGSGVLFTVCLIFCFSVAAASIMVGLRKRDPDSINTPKDFNKKFFWLDNAGRILGNIILLFVLVRFVRVWVFPIKIDQITQDTVENHPELQLLLSVLVGLFSDMIFRWLQKLRLLGNKKVREKFASAGLTDKDQDEIDSKYTRVN